MPLLSHGLFSPNDREASHMLRLKLMASYSLGSMFKILFPKVLNTMGWTSTYPFMDFLKNIISLYGMKYPGLVVMVEAY